MTAGHTPVFRLHGSIFKVFTPPCRGDTWCKSNKAIVDSILRPHCVLPSPFPGWSCIFNGEENPFPPIGDAAYHKRVGGGLSHRKATCTKNFVKTVRMVPDIYALSVGKKNPSRRYAMQPIVNMLEEDQAVNIGNMHKNLVKIVRVVPEISSQTDPQTDILITILCNRSHGQSKNVIFTT